MWYLDPVPAPAPGGGGNSNCPADGSESCAEAKCCSTPGQKCYEKNKYWASCKETCTPGIDPLDPPKYQTPWSCKVLGSGPAPSPQPAPEPRPEPRPEPSPSPAGGVVKVGKKKCDASEVK